MPIVQRPYVPPEDKPPQEESYINPGDVAPLNVNTATAAAPAQAEGATSLDAITFYSDSFHVFSSLYSAVLFFGEQLEEREPILRARIKVSPQMMKAIAVLATKHVREYEEAVGPISLPDQVFAAWELNPDGTSNVDGQGH
ncbi:MAG: hypothetical protein OXI54_14765 [Chloroflexota bacterium]|nr:hypothetical protein [Chloroflexota bacterium]MDE2685389.1 hypothetical protein [Chloroflexota bacterium]